MSCVCLLKVFLRRRCCRGKVLLGSQPRGLRAAVVSDCTGGCASLSSESEDSDECAAEMVEEKDDVELLPRARRGSASGMLPLL